MKRKLTELAVWGSLTAAVLAAALGGAEPVMLQSPGVAIALGVIGIGLIKHARERAAARPCRAMRPEARNC